MWAFSNETGDRLFVREGARSANSEGPFVFLALMVARFPPWKRAIRAEARRSSSTTPAYRLQRGNPLLLAGWAAPTNPRDGITERPGRRHYGRLASGEIGSIQHAR